MALLYQGDELLDGFQRELSVGVHRWNGRAICGVQRNAQPKALAIENFDEALAVGRVALPEDLKPAAEEGMGRIGDFDHLRMSESRCIEWGIMGTPLSSSTE